MASRAVAKNCDADGQPTGFTVTRARAGWLEDRGSMALSLLRIAQSAVEDSRKLLSYGDDWDENGSPAVNAAILAVAQHWLLGAVAELPAQLGGVVEAICFLPGPTGGVDVLFKGKQLELAFSFEPGTEHLSRYYGDDLGKAGKTVSGVFKPGDSLAALLGTLSS